MTLTDRKAPRTQSDGAEMRELNEPILPDDYPVYAGYSYVVDGVPMSSPIEGTVRRLKLVFKTTEVRRCDLIGREMRAKSESAS